jgi:hypothetical protein
VNPAVFKIPFGNPRVFSVVHDEVIVSFNLPADGASAANQADNPKTEEVE